MAKLDSVFKIKGTIGNLTAYKRVGSDEVFLRRKGGPSAARVKKSPEYVNLRRENAEFGGRATTTKWMTPILSPLKHIANFPITGKLNKLLKPAQELDKVSEWGKRNVLLSLNPRVLEGFNLNSEFFLESVIRSGLSHTISKDMMTAQVSLSSLVAGNNLFIPDYYDWYQVRAVLGIIPDHVYKGNRYRPIEEVNTFRFVKSDTAWFAAKEGSAGLELQLALDPVNLTSFSLMLLVGVSFGKAVSTNYIEAVKHVGAAKIVGMV